MLDLLAGTEGVELKLSRTVLGQHIHMEIASYRLSDTRLRCCSSCSAGERCGLRRRSNRLFSAEVISTCYFVNVFEFGQYSFHIIMFYSVNVK